MRSAGWLALPVTLLVLAAPTWAGGDGGAPRPSFDCTNASTRIEKMICSDVETSELDGKLAEIYRRALADPAGNPDEIRIEQHAWLSGKRNKCRDVVCLRRSHRERIAALEAPMRPTEVEIRTGSAPVCEPVREEIVQRWAVLHGVHAPTRLQKIDWIEVDTSSLPRELRGPTETQSFDFDNDGVPDRVYQVEFDNHYMEGTVLLVQRGPKLTDRWLLPCQLDARAFAVEDCPPFPSQKGDEAGLAMQGATAKEKVFFRGRYAELTVFRFEESTFVAVEGGWAKGATDETVRYVAVIKPIAGKKFERTCLLRVSGAL